MRSLLRDSFSRHVDIRGRQERRRRDGWTSSSLGLHSESESVWDSKVAALRSALSADPGFVGNFGGEGGLGLWVSRSWYNEL